MINYPPECHKYVLQPKEKSQMLKGMLRPRKLWCGGLTYTSKKVLLYILLQIKFRMLLLKLTIKEHIRWRNQKLICWIDARTLQYENDESVQNVYKRFSSITYHTHLQVVKTTHSFIFLHESWTSKVEVIEEATYTPRMVTQSNTPIIFKPRIK